MTRPTFTFPSTVRQVNSGFDDTRDWGLHAATDFNNWYGMPIVASAPGVVQFADWAGNAGRMVTVLHEAGWLTRYVHLSSVDVRPGQLVGRGQLVGLSGASGYGINWYYGPHLHFAVWAPTRAAALAVQRDPYPANGFYAVDPMKVLVEAVAPPPPPAIEQEDALIIIASASNPVSKFILKDGVRKVPLTYPALKAIAGAPYVQPEDANRALDSAPALFHSRIMSVADFDAIPFEPDPATNVDVIAAFAKAAQDLGKSVGGKK